MPISELEKKWWGMNFNIAAEEMRRLKETPTEEEQLVLYSLYKQALHGDIPSEDLYIRPNSDTWAQRKYDAWLAIKGKSQERAKEDYVQAAQEMIKKYGRSIVRSQWNSQVWTVDY
uniref:ACB domain-containing protein n=1 Tax=Plectus sambesii TaxID=2011161 RepID=A0A914XPI0_9BILA